MSLDRKLGLKDGIPLAIGSIIGSGILFLPSLTYSISTSEIALVWLLTTLFCIPLIFIFSDMVKEVPNEAGIEGFISLGLGKTIGGILPWLMISTVGIGMPSAALVVGEFVKNSFNSTEFIKYCIAFFLIYSGIITNLIGIKIGSKIQRIITITLFLLAISLIFLTTSLEPSSYMKIVPNFELPKILPGIVACFWAYAGFENLTFLAGEFKNPKRDFPVSMIVSLIFCGLLYLILSINYATNISINEVNPVLGIYQLSTKITAIKRLDLIVLVFSFLAVQINLNSWTWGISRLIYSSSKQDKLPKFLSSLNKRRVPSRSIYLLGIIFTISLVISFIFPKGFEAGLIIVSSNFVFIYLLCLLSYLSFTKSKFKKILTFSLIIFLSFALISSGIKLIYPFIIFGLGFLYSRARRKK